MLTSANTGPDIDRCGFTSAADVDPPLKGMGAVALVIAGCVWQVQVQKAVMEVDVFDEPVAR